MKPIFSFGLAAIVTAFLAQPANAGWNGGGGHVGGGGAVHFSAPAAHFSAPAMHYSAPTAHYSAPVMRAPSVAHFNATQVQPHYYNYNPSVATRTAPSTTVQPFVTQNRTFTQPRTFVQPQRTAPSIAFGGTNAAGFRGNANPRTASVPAEVSRGWDRRHIHNFDHHHFRFFNGGWVIADDGFYGYPYGDYPYGYYDNYDQPSTYSSPAYSYDYSSSDSLISDVQNQLTRLGYVTGPADGDMGPLTQNAVAQFQRDNNLPITGRLNSVTLQALGIQQ